MRIILSFWHFIFSALPMEPLNALHCAQFNVIRDFHRNVSSPFLFSQQSHYFQSKFHICSIFWNWITHMRTCDAVTCGSYLIYARYYVHHSGCKINTFLFYNRIIGKSLSVSFYISLSLQKPWWYEKDAFRAVQAVGIGATFRFAMSQWHSPLPLHQLVCPYLPIHRA